jgi:hypothetical protein
MFLVFRKLTPSAFLPFSIFSLEIETISVISLPQIEITLSESANDPILVRSTEIGHLPVNGSPKENGRSSSKQFR